MSESRRWALPLLSAGQAQKEITHNEAILAIDRLLQLAVVSRAANTPPETAVPGDIHIVGPAPTGEWTGKAGQLASFEGAGWTIMQPRTGCLAWIADEQEFSVLRSDGWSPGGWPTSGLRIGNRLLLASEPETVAEASGGSMIDAECRVVLTALLAALRSQGVIA